MKTKRKILDIAVLLFTLVMVLGTFPVETKADLYDYLTIKVGYEEGPFYNKYTISKAEMERYAGNEVRAFTHVDRGGGLSYNFAVGLPLKTLLERAGIDERSIKRFVLVTPDKYIENNQDITRKYLLQTERYYYPELYRYFYTDQKYDLGLQGGGPVEPFIAVKSLYANMKIDVATDIDTFGEKLKETEEKARNGDPTVLTDRTTFRLMLGTDPNFKIPTTQYTAQNLYEIKVILGGAPTVKIQEEDIIRDEKVGSETLPKYDENGNPILRKGDKIALDKLDWTVEGNEGEVEDEIEQGNGFSRDTMGEALVKEYGEGADKLDIKINEKLGYINENNEFVLTEDLKEGDMLFDEVKVADRDGNNLIASTGSNSIKTTLGSRDVVYVPEPTPPKPPNPGTNPGGSGDSPGTGGEVPGSGDEGGGTSKPGEAPESGSGTGGETKPGETPGSGSGIGGESKPGDSPGTGSGTGSGSGSSSSGETSSGGQSGSSSSWTGNRSAGGNGTGSGSGSGNSGNGGSGTDGTGNGNSSGNGSDSMNSYRFGESGDSSGNQPGSGTGSGSASSAGSSGAAGSNSGTGGSSGGIRGTGGDRFILSKGTDASSKESSVFDRGNKKSSKKGEESIRAERKNTSSRGSERVKPESEKQNSAKKPENQTDGKLSPSKENGKRFEGNQVYEMDDDAIQLGNVYQYNPLTPYAIFTVILGFIFGIFYGRWRFLNSL